MFVIARKTAELVMCFTVFTGCYKCGEITVDEMCRACSTIENRLIGLV